MAGNTASQVRTARRCTDGITGAAVSGGPIWGEVLVITVCPRSRDPRRKVDLSAGGQRRVWLCPPWKVAPHGLEPTETSSRWSGIPGDRWRHVEQPADRWADYGGAAEGAPS